MNFATRGDAAAEPGNATLYDQLDTTKASLLHKWTAYNGKIWWRGIVTYLVTVGLTYGLLLLAVLLGNVPAAAESDDVELPFFKDWNIVFTFFVSVPTVLFLLISDQSVLKRALQKVMAANVVVLPEQTGSQLLKDWSERYRLNNLRGQWIILLISAFLAAGTLEIYRGTGAKFWASPGSHLTLVSAVYWYAITVLYFVLGYYCFRCIQQAIFLRELVGKAAFHMRPFHPDGCGGLQPIGRLGLRNQYTLTVLGINIVIVAAINYNGVADPARVQIEILVAIAVAIYLLLGPIVFLAPLIPFGEKMREAKYELMSGVGDRLRDEFRSVQDKLHDKAIDKDELESLERLKKLAEMLDEIPVWPFDARTLRRFGTAYFLPFAISLATKAATTLLFEMPGKN